MKSFMLMALAMNLLLATKVFAADVTWNPNDKQSNIDLADHNLDARGGRFPDGTISVNDSVRANAGSADGRYYFEVEVERLGRNYYAGIGVATRHLNLELGIGSDENDSGCGYSPDGVVTCDHRRGIEQYEPYKRGDVIGVAVDLRAERIYFSRNGVWQGEVNGDVPGLPLPRTGEIYFPAVNVSHGDTFEGKFKREKFKFGIPIGHQPLTRP